MPYPKRSLRKTKKAVSDIIGNLLILAITVTLFSSVMFFVANQPAPQTTTYAEMEFNAPANANDAFWVNLTHKGGQVLKNETTNIIITIDGVTSVKKITDSTPKIGTTWATGQTWSYNLGSGLGTKNITVMIVNSETNNIVWQSTLNGGSSANFSPIIGTKGTTPTPAVEGVAPVFHAFVTDPDGNLLSVKVNLTNIGGSLMTMTDPDGDGVYTLTSPSTASLTWNGKYIEFVARDSTGKMAISRLYLSVIPSSGGTGNNSFWDKYSGYLVNGTYPPDASGGESGGASGAFGTTFYYIRYVPDNSITRKFNGSDHIMIELYSDALKNLALENSLIVLNSAGTTVTPPTNYTAFSYGGIYGTFYRYEYKFYAPSTADIYSLRIKLRDNVGTVINLVDQISVGGASRPYLMFYNVTSTGGLTQQDSFNHTNTIALKIFTNTVDSTMSTVGFSDLEIADYSGKYIIKLAPAAQAAYPAINWAGPISQIYKTNGLSSTRVADNDPLGVYTVQIDPKKAFQGWWLANRNSYSCKISIFQDSDESYGQLSRQLNMTAPATTTDIVASVGSGSFTWSSSGAAWSNNKLEWYKGGERSDQWTKVVIADPTYKGPLGMILADMDGDSYRDLVVGFQDTSIAVAWYRNEKIDGTKWSTVPTVIANTFDALSGTQNAGGTSKGNTDEDTTVWSGYYDEFYPSGTSYVSTNELVGAIGAGDLDHDGLMDIVVSYLHPVTYTDAMSSGSASYSNSWGMYFNRCIKVYWSSAPANTATTLYSTTDWIAANTANDNSNPAAVDLQVADMNNDGWDDIVAVYETGTTKVWLNQFPKETSGDWYTRRANSFAASSLITDIPTVTGTTAWGNYNMANRVFPSLELADVNGDTLTDIVRTSSSDNKVTIFYTQSNMALETKYAPTLESGTGTLTGTRANLLTWDGVLESITDVFTQGVNSPAYAYEKGTLDTTGSTLGTTLNLVDTTYYNVPANAGTNRLHLASFDMSTIPSNAIITGARLHVNYAVGSTFGPTAATANYVQYSNNNGSSFTSAGIQPITGETAAQDRTFNLFAAGVDTWNELRYLDVSYINNDGGTNTNDRVRFDMIRVEVTYIAWNLQYTYEIPNINAYPYHWLTVNASVSATPAEFTLQYSADGTVWNTLGTITDTVARNYTYQLASTPNLKYYVRVIDTTTYAARAGQNFTISMDQLIINHTRSASDPLVVYWTAGNRYTDFDYVQPVTNIGSGRVSCIAVGDVGTTGTSPSRVDGLKDIVIGSTESDGSGVLYVAIHKIGGFNDPTEISTTTLGTTVGSKSALFRTQDVELGDFNGDKYTDIALLIGYNVGRSESTPSTPTLWVYMNQANPTDLQFTEQSVNSMVTGESGINIETANIDLTIFLPFLGLMAIPAAVIYVDRKEKKGSK